LARQPQQGRGSARTDMRVVATRNKYCPTGAIDQGRSARLGTVLARGERWTVTAMFWRHAVPDRTSGTEDHYELWAGPVFTPRCPESARSTNLDGGTGPYPSAPVTKNTRRTHGKFLPGSLGHTAVPRRQTGFSQVDPLHSGRRACAPEPVSPSLAVSRA